MSKEPAQSDPLRFILERLKSGLSPAEVRELKADLREICPPGSAANPKPVILPLDVPAAAQAPDGGKTSRLSAAVPGEPLFGYQPEAEASPEPAGGVEPWMQELRLALNVLQERYPLRAAVVFLKAVIRILAEMLEEGKTELLNQEEVVIAISLLLHRIEAVAGRCENCPLSNMSRQ